MDHPKSDKSMMRGHSQLQQGKLFSHAFRTATVSAAALFVTGAGCLAATFDEQRKAVSAAIESQSEDAILSLLKSGIEEGKPTEAIAEARKWLRQNLPKNAMLLFHAGRAAELSGDASEAAALYQQYLKVADPKAETTGQAMIAVHALLRDQLKDVSSAYSANRILGDRLAVNPAARQFDQWFLEEAKRRKDAVAVANRLHALIKAGIPDALRTTFYDSHYRWLLEQADIYVEQPGAVVSSDELVAACKQLSAAMTFNEELALRLDWAVSVRAYNLAKIAEKDVAPPIAEATALLEKYPRYAMWVQTGWAGGGNGQYYRGDVAKYWPHEIEAKMAPVVAAAAKLTPLQLADLMQSWGAGYYSHNVVRPLEVKAVRQPYHFSRYGNKLTARNGVLIFGNTPDQFTPEWAKSVAPQLTQIADPQASWIRVIAAGGEEKDLNKMIAALIGPEAWRLGPAELDGRYADQLWHFAGRPGDTANRDQKIKESKAVSDQIKAAGLDVKAAPAQRLGLFRKLWADYRSNQPKIPGVVGQLKTILQITPEAIPELLRDQSVEAQMLARDAIAAGISGSDPIWVELETTNKVSVTAYAPGILYLAARHAGGSVPELKKRLPQKCIPHPLEAAMRQSVSDGLKQNKLEAWQVIAWVNMQYPEDNEEQVKLAQALIKSPQWKSMPFEVQYAVLEWFGKAVMTPEQIAWVDAADPALVCGDLLALVEEEGAPEEGKKGNKKGQKRERKIREKAEGELDEATKAAIAAEDVEFAVAALQSTVEGIEKSPVRIAIPDKALENLATLDRAVFVDAKAQELMLKLIDQLKAIQPTINFAGRLLEAVAKNPDPLVLHRVAPFLWEGVNRNVRSFEAVKALTQSLVEEHPSAASAFASAGLEAIARHRGHTYYKREVDIPLLKSIRGNAAMKMGLIVIPVAKNHPAYPVYQAQGDWITGNEDSAWELLSENWEAFLPVQRELSVPFIMWTLQRTIYGRDEARQEALIKSLLDWAEEAGSPLSPTEKAQIEIAYGDIAMKRGQLAQAHEIYSRTQKKEAYQELSIRYQAALRRVAAERVASNFDGALKTLAEIELERVPEIWEQTRYARALVYFDMEEYDDAKDDIDSILARNPEQADAKILLGKVQLKRQKLMEATEVELGTAAGQKSLVPGERLKVTLVDPTLAVSGAGTEIEVVVWATSGDKETFFLRQFGDSKTKFRGEVETALGAPTAGDDILQVIGDDEVYYAYSERFREKMNNLEEKRGGPIIVASDAILMASARKLLTEAEQRTADMAAVMDSIKGATEGTAKAVMAARSMSAEARAEKDGFSEAELGRFVTNVAKPGNPIHVRVIDPDRSRTAGIDELNISVATSSGDSVSRVTLKETGTHSGWFEGSIPTTGAQALAFSRNSEPGRNPNMVISPQAASYPAWRPLAAEGTTPDFTVDLNDNVAIDELTIVAKEAGATLKNFYLQTGMNESEMTTIATYPSEVVAAKEPWKPSVVVMNDTDQHHTQDKRSVYDITELKEQVERGWLTQTYAAGAAGNVAGPSEAMTESIPGRVKWLRQNQHHNSHIIYRFRGYFHEPTEVVRRFKLELGNYQVPKDTHPSVSNPPQFLLAVDGRPITDAEKPGLLEGEVNLRPGIHYFEIWATGWDCAIGFGRSVRLQANLEGEDQLVDCPDAFFDPATFPEGTLDHRNSPATVEANEEGTEFKVRFAPDSRARLLKLVFLKNEGPVPALNKITLSKPDGKQVLPVAEDFAALNKNGVLEILTGDKISVRYVDDRFVTKTKERLERSLQVAFTDARVEFADMEPRFDSGHGKDMPYYERLLRFPYEEPLSLAIHDADMDVSIKPDKVKVTLLSEAGSAREFEALETGDSTGIFKVVVVPVKGDAAADQIKVAEGGVITAIYLDRENNRPGVPTERTATIGHAAFAKPEFNLTNATVTPFESEATRSLTHGFERRNFHDPDRERIASERIRPRWQVENVLLPGTEAPEGGFNVVHGRTVYLELVAPHLCLGTSSGVTVYAQTDSGRRRAGAGAGGFDITVPGTVALSATTGQTFAHGVPWRDVPQLEIYQGGEVPSSNTPQYDRFKLSVPLVAGMPPLEGALTYEERKELAEDAKTSRSAAAALDQLQRIGGLVVKPGELIHFGFQYTGADGKKQWLTASAKVVTQPAFDIMSEDYREPMTTAYVGETLNLRVVDLGSDTTDDSDQVSVLVQGKSGEKHLVELRESGPHTGIFKSSPVLSYAPTKKDAPAPDGEGEAAYDVRSQGFPVVYGDTVAARYTDANGVKSDVAMVTISKGADGTIQPFSKTYEDAEIATRTQFSLAEAYLEMAKRHRKLDQPEAAAIEYASAKQLLSKAMDEFTDPETRAHAEYLLGTLTMEEADATEESEMQETRYRAALSRFLSVTGSYPQTLHASKAQYQIANLYERLKEPDIAAQEYVKLAYKYPDSEYLATSMARLGSHFLKTAAAYEAKAKPLLEQLDNKDAQFEGAALQKMAVREYIKTAQIFGRLQQRFPSDSLAGEAGLRAGQAFMRAEKKQEAIDSFQRVINDESYDGSKVRAQAMYWTGMCYQDLRQQMAAYSTFKRLTYDFPESKWAAYARAQLSQESLLNLENKLELERLEGEQ
jgi:outer membrane protein assembly factor BamD (BamD/ComL family)